MSHKNLISENGNSDYEPKLAELQSQLTEMKSVLDSYRNEVSSLRQELKLRDQSFNLAQNPNPTSRRQVLKKFAAGAAGVTALSLATALNSSSVRAETASDNALEAQPGTNGYGGKFGAGLANIYLTPSGSAGAPLAGTHQKGELLVDSLGELYYCAADGTPGTWRKISGTSSAGSLILVASPVRNIDTRSAYEVIPVGDPHGQLLPNVTKNYTIAGLNGIPLNATGIIGTVAIIAAGYTPNGGSALLSMGGVTATNWLTVTTILSSTFTAQLNGGKLAVFSSTTTDIVITVTGYYA